MSTLFSLSRAFFFCCLLFSFTASTISFQANAASGNASMPTTSAQKNTPQTVPEEKKNGKSTPVFVELEGTDTIGAKLSMQLQEIFNGSSLFTISSKDEPKIRILIQTQTEFADRPELGSAYSVVWLYYERASLFNSYLAGEVGVVSGNEIPALAIRLAERTTSLAARYSYIFNPPEPSVK